MKDSVQTKGKAEMTGVRTRHNTVEFAVEQYERFSPNKGNGGDDGCRDKRYIVSRIVGLYPAMDAQSLVLGIIIRDILLIL